MKQMEDMKNSILDLSSLLFVLVLLLRIVVDRKVLLLIGKVLLLIRIR